MAIEEHSEKYVFLEEFMSGVVKTYTLLQKSKRASVTDVKVASSGIMTEIVSRVKEVDPQIEGIMLEYILTTGNSSSTTCYTYVEGEFAEELRTVWSPTKNISGQFSKTLYYLDLLISETMSGSVTATTTETTMDAVKTQGRFYESVWYKGGMAQEATGQFSEDIITKAYSVHAPQGGVFSEELTTYTVETQLNKFIKRPVEPVSWKKQ